MSRILLALTLTLHGAGWSSAGMAGGVPSDAAQSSHDDHAAMSHPMTANDPVSQPAGGCCEDGTMDCQCGCIVHTPASLSIEPVVCGWMGARAPSAVMVSRHPSNPATTPFRPPA